VAAGLVFASRGRGDELNLNQEALIEKMWDDNTLEGATQLNEKEVGFVPAPPPMKMSPPTSDEEE
jgi:hypothetical protein